MAVALTTPKSVVVGGSITVTGTGLTTSGSVHVKIYGPGDSTITEVILTASGGAVDMSTAAIVRPYKPGYYTVAVKDITAGTTTKQQVRVYGG